MFSVLIRNTQQKQEAPTVQIRLFYDLVLGVFNIFQSNLMIFYLMYLLKFSVCSITTNLISFSKYKGFKMGPTPILFSVGRVQFLSVFFCLARL